LRLVERAEQREREREREGRNEEKRKEGKHGAPCAQTEMDIPRDGARAARLAVVIP
jgi:hypothetical protein